MKLAKYIGQQMLDIVKFSLKEPVICSYHVSLTILRSNFQAMTNLLIFFEEPSISNGPASMFVENFYYGGSHKKNADFSTSCDFCSQSKQHHLKFDNIGGAIQIQNIGHEIKPSSGSLMDAAMTVIEEANDRFDRLGNHYGQMCGPCSRRSESLIEFNFNQQNNRAPKPVT